MLVSIGNLLVSSCNMSKRYSMQRIVKKSFSLCMVVHNCANQLENLLSNYNQYFDDIVIYVMESQDGTDLIADKYANTVIKVKNVGYEEYYYHDAISMCKNKWIFLSHSYEKISDELLSHMQKMDTNDLQLSGYYINIVNDDSDYYTKLRLFRKIDAYIPYLYGRDFQSISRQTATLKDEYCIYDESGNISNSNHYSNLMQYKLNIKFAPEYIRLKYPHYTSDMTSYLGKFFPSELFTYNPDNYFYNESFLDAFGRYVGNKAQVFDFLCGDGKNIKYLKQMCRIVDGCDIFPDTPNVSQGYGAFLRLLNPDFQIKKKYNYGICLSNLSLNEEKTKILVNNIMKMVKDGFVIRRNSPLYKYIDKYFNPQLFDKTRSELLSLRSNEKLLWVNTGCK